MKDGPRKLDLGDLEEIRDRGYDLEFIEDLLNAVEDINFNGRHEWLCRRLSRKFPEVYVELCRQLKPKLKKKTKNGRSFVDEVEDDDVPF